jgi:hypothetical protein
MPLSRKGTFRSLNRSPCYRSIIRRAPGAEYPSTHFMTEKGLSSSFKLRFECVKQSFDTELLLGFVLCFRDSVRAEAKPIPPWTPSQYALHRLLRPAARLGCRRFPECWGESKGRGG